MPPATRSIAAVRLMLDCGWPIDVRGQHGATALHWAGFHGNLELARLLLDRAAPLDVVDTDHDGTPLFWALYGSSTAGAAGTGNYPAVVEALLDAGANRPAGDRHPCERSGPRGPESPGLVGRVLDPAWDR